jgi:hypothetical protein
MLKGGHKHYKQSIKSTERAYKQYKQYKQTIHRTEKAHKQ